jgi:hypothetical protein
LGWCLRRVSAMRALIPVAAALIASTGGPAPAQQQQQ